MEAGFLKAKSEITGKFLSMAFTVNERHILERALNAIKYLLAILIRSPENRSLH